MGPLIILDVASRKEIKRVDTGGGSSILITPDGSRAYAGMSGADKVAALDLGKRDAVSEIRTGDGPDGMDWVGKPGTALIRTDLTRPSRPSPQPLVRVNKQESVG
jgi:hypothetical protein